MTYKPRRIMRYGETYHKSWSELQKTYDNKIERHIITELLPNEGDWFIDIAGGFGRMADLYLNRFKNCVLVDYSPELLQVAQERYKEATNLNYVLADAYYLPFRSNSFDASIMVRLLHHLQDPNVTFKEVARILRGGARLVTNYRNRRDIRNIVRYLLKLPNCGPFEVAHSDPTGRNQLQAFTHPSIAKEWFRKASFVIKKERGSSFFGGKILHVFKNTTKFEAWLSPLLGKTKLSPLVFFNLEVDKISNSEKSDKRDNLQDIIVCPLCKGDLFVEPKSYQCRSCKHEFPVVDGMIDLRRQ